ncbi:MAG: PKD domain-containing protein, partial [Acidobacteria bacterium]
MANLPAGAGSPLAPPIPQRNPDFSIAPDSIGSSHPFTEVTLITTERGLVKIADGLARFIPFPAEAGEPLGSPVPRNNPAFNPAFSSSGSVQGDPRPFTEQLLVSVTNGLVIVEDETADFVPIPAEAGRVIAQPLSLINARFTLFPPTLASPDDVRFFLPTIVLVTERGVMYIDEDQTQFIPVPREAGRIISPPMVALNPDFNPFFPLSGAGSPRPFLSTQLVSTTKGLVSIHEGRASFIPVPPAAGQVLSPPLFILNPAFNPTYDPGNPVGSPTPFTSDVLLGTTEGVVLITDGVPRFIPLPAGAGLPVSSPIPLTEFGVGVKIIVPVTNGIVQMTGSEAQFIPLPASAGRVVGAPYIDPSGRLWLAVSRGLARVTGTVVEFVPLPEEADEVINGPIVDSGDARSVVLQTARGFVRVVETSATFIPLPEEAGQHVVPRLLLSQAAVGNQPPVANAGPDRTVSVGMPVTFDGSASFDPDGMIVDFAWDFGDGTFASGPVVTHIYHQPGQFTVRLTVTDDEGAQSSDSAGIAVVDTEPPTVTLQRPIGGETIPTGSRFTIRWISSDNVAVVSHELWLAPDGVHFDTPIATNLSGFAQSFDWSVPSNLVSNQARLRVIARDAAGNVGQAESGPFAIRDGQPPHVAIQSPRGGEVIPAGSSFLIRWTSSDNVGVVSHDILLALDGFNFNSTIAVGLPGSVHQFNWSIPITMASTSARIRIIARDAAGNIGQSDSGPFTIRDTTPPTVSIQSPRGGETLVPGTLFTIRWSSSDNLAVTSHDVVLATDGVHFTITISSGLPGSAQSLTWSIPSNVATDSARIRIIARDAAGNTGQSESGLFIIRDTLPPAVTVNEPFPGQIINGGNSFTIRWSALDNVGVTSQDILLSTDGGASFPILIASGLGGQQTSFLWSVPGHLATTSAVIRVRAFDAAGNTGQGDSGPFTIRDAQPPSVVVIAPSGGQIVPP